jgi:hypothetical protein
MKSRLALVAFACLCAISAARADNRIFIVANQPDGYGIDECLARGERCGAPAARAYCQSRDFADATAYRRVEADDVTGAIPVSDRCGKSGCGQFIAITCHR